MNSVTSLNSSEVQSRLSLLLFLKDSNTTNKSMKNLKCFFYR